MEGLALSGWSAGNLRHVVGLFRQGRNPAAAVYESLGADFFLAPAPGWLNLGLWEGDGSDPAEAPVAVRRLVEHLAADLPVGGDVLDVGNGLGAQDPVIASVATPRSLTVVNITHSQLVAGRVRLAEAGARAVNADATRLPIRDASMDGIISVEAAFHFPSRARFFDEALRVLRPGGVLTMSDIPTQRSPRGPAELVSALTQLRVWGLGVHAAATAEEIADTARRAGFVEVHTELVGPRVIAPALRLVHERLRRPQPGVPRGQVLASRLLLAQVDVLWAHGLIDYLLLRGSKPR
ncbi:MAG: methyltransferase domain-containing protein [Actinomycetota bacterium]